MPQFKKVIDNRYEKGWHVLNDAGQAVALITKITNTRTDTHPYKVFPVKTQGSQMGMVPAGAQMKPFYDEDGGKAAAIKYALSLGNKSESVVSSVNKKKIGEGVTIMKKSIKKEGYDKPRICNWCGQDISKVDHRPGCIDYQDEPDPDIQDESRGDSQAWARATSYHPNRIKRPKNEAAQTGAQNDDLTPAQKGPCPECGRDLFHDEECSKFGTNEGVRSKRSLVEHAKRGNKVTTPHGDGVVLTVNSNMVRVKLNAGAIIKVLRSRVVVKN